MQPLWHVLDIRAIWIKEFTSALGKQVPVLGWLPQISVLGLLKNIEQDEILGDPPLRIRNFPLQRGFGHRVVDLIAREGIRIADRLANQSRNASASPLICSTPHYAEVAVRWPGPVVYYVTDLFMAYGGDPRLIKSLDLRMCKAAALVCPNSQRIADYLISEASCPRERIQIIPNATREDNLLPDVRAIPTTYPDDIEDLQRPLAGVIGNLAANIDWELIRSVVDRTPWLSWVFVGPTDMPIPETRQDQARRELMRRGGHVRFVGYKPYGMLREYARALDVAILPYRKREPTYSGSSTRFYEHLAACKPILATRGFEELLHKEPLLRLVDTAEEMVAQLDDLYESKFQDGCEQLRWSVSRDQTWEARALTMRNALAQSYVSSNGVRSEAI